MSEQYKMSFNSLSNALGFPLYFSVFGSQVSYAERRLNL